MPVFDIVYRLLRGFAIHGGLRKAKLRGADLSGAYLREADLCEADFTGANLHDADLVWADVHRANFTGADLRKADFMDAELSGAIGLPVPPPEVSAKLLRAVAEAALTTPGGLEMSTWHTCETTHCIAGWAIHLAGDEGRALEQRYGSQIAGLMLLGEEARSHFFDSNDEAREYLERVRSNGEV